MIFEGVSKTTYPMKKMDNAQLYWPFVSFKEVASPRTLAFPMFALADRFSIHIMISEFWYYAPVNVRREIEEHRDWHNPQVNLPPCLLHQLWIQMLELDPRRLPVVAARLDRRRIAQRGRVSLDCHCDTRSSTKKNVEVPAASGPGENSQLVEFRDAP